MGNVKKDFDKQGDVYYQSHDLRCLSRGLRFVGDVSERELHIAYVRATLDGKIDSSDINDPQKHLKKFQYNKFEKCARKLTSAFNSLPKPMHTALAVASLCCFGLIVAGMTPYFTAPALICKGIMFAVALPKMSNLYFQGLPVLMQGKDTSIAQFYDNVGIKHISRFTEAEREASIENYETHGAKDAALLELALLRIGAPLDVVRNAHPLSYECYDLLKDVLTYSSKEVEKIEKNEERRRKALEFHHKRAHQNTQPLTAMA